MKHSGRASYGITPEERIASVVADFQYQHIAQYARPPCAADYRDMLRPYLRREILLALASEAELPPSRKRELAVEFLQLSEELGWNAT